MNKIILLIITLISFPVFSIDNCEQGVSKKINQSGHLTEKDREKLMDDCNKFQDYRLNLDKYAQGAYLLNSSSFTCRKKEDYIEAYNWVIERGGKYSPKEIDRFKSCRTIKTPTLVAVRSDRDPSDPVVPIVYANEYSVYYLHSQWVHGAELIPYSDLISQKIVSSKDDNFTYADLVNKYVGKPIPYDQFNVIGQPETLTGTNNQYWVVYFPKGDFTLVSEKKTDIVKTVYTGRKPK